MKKKVLVVDDNQELTAMLEEQLSSRNYEVFTAHDGAEGLDAAKEKRPDVIILDIMMPKINGVEMSKRLKEEPSTADIPVIFLTILKDRVKGGKPDSTPNIILAKPFSLSELLQTIESVL